MKKLIEIQGELKAPKNQYNSFGKYKYRNCEDILEALKPLLKKHECTLTLCDDISEVGGVLIVTATACITHEGERICVSSSAGIDTNAKGMSIAQSFGASSSYARKYALSGLFLLDDTKDADATNTHGKEATKAEIDPEILEQLELINDKDALGKYYKQIQKAGFMTEAIKSEFTKKAATL